MISCYYQVFVEVPRPTAAKKGIRLGLGLGLRVELYEVHRLKRRPRS